MTLLRNLRYSARSFARTPAITALLVITIAVGVGSNASVHGFVRGLITRDMPGVAADRVVSVFARDADRGAGPLSLEDFAWMKTHVQAFEWLGAVRELQATIELAGREDVLAVAAVTPPVARLLGMSLADGVVLSQQLRETAFAGRSDVHGERIRIDGAETRVSGVAPAWLEGLYLGRDVDIWMPLRDEAPQAVDRRSMTLSVLGRLRRGTTMSQALAEVRSRPTASGKIALLAYTGVTPELADGLTRVHTLLTLAAGAVFLIVCANVASFLLARGSARSLETSLRVALGASRSQLVAQLLSDSVVIAVAGGAFGVLIAMWTADIVPALLFEADAGQLVFVPDVSSIAMASVVCAAVTILCGLTPLLEVRHDRPAIVLRRESMGPSTTMRRLRAGLVVAEMTACCVLVISTGILLQSFRSAVQTTVGRRFNRAILATVQSAQDDPAYFQDVDTAARAAVRSSVWAWVARPVGSRPAWRSFRIEPPHVPLRDATMDVAAFTPETLEEIAVPPVAGRLFGVRDGPQDCRVAVVNDAAADQVFGGDAVGRVIEDPMRKRVEIIGVVAPRVKRGATNLDPPTVYYFPGQTQLPLGHAGPARFRVPAPVRLAPAVLSSNIVSGGYFDGTGSSRVAGRLFPGGPLPSGCRVAVINQEAAREYFGGDAVGGAVIDPRGERTEIIGVVSSATLGRFERRPEPTIFFPMQQDLVRRMTLMIDPVPASGLSLDTVRARLGAVAGRADAPVVVERLEERLARTSLAPLHIAAVLVRASAGMALVLAVVGVFGALTEATRRRRREIGVRRALGAQGWRVVGMVVAEGGRLAALGAGLGMLCALAVKGMVVRVAPGGTATTFEMWLAGPLLLLAVVVVASVLPAARAVMVDPVRVLRDEG